MKRRPRRALAPATQVEQRLRESEMRYRRLFESAKDGVLILDAATGMVEDVNPFLTHLLGFSHEQFLGKKLWELGCFRDIVANQAHFVELQEKEYIRYEDMALETVDGRRIDVEFVSNVYLVNDRKVIQCNIRDITERKRVAEALRASEVKFQGIFQSSRDALMTLEPPLWTFTSGNPATVRMFAAKNEEDILSRQPWELSPERQPDGRASAEKAREMIETAMREGSQFFEWTHRRLDGEEFAANVLLTRVEIGRKVILQATVRDVTETKAAEEALVRLSRQHERILFSAAEGILGLDWQGNHTFVNPAAARMLGYEAAELLGRQSHSTWHHTKPDGSVYPKEECRIYAAYRDGEVHRVSDEVFWRKDGSRFPVEYASTPVYAQGRLVGAVVTFTDITERKRAEESLRLESAALQAAVEAIVITNRAGVIERVNPAFTQLTGYTAEEALGKNPSDLVKSGKHTAAFYQDFWETIVSGRTWRGEMVNRRKDGSLYTEEQDVTPFRDASGDITHFVAIKRDITERLKLEAQFRQAQKMESVGQLASGIAHDFNNLLTVINGMSELVLADVSPDSQLHADVREIQRAGERAAALTRQLLAFSRQQILEPRVLSLSAVVAGIESLLKRLLGENIDLVVVLTPESGRVKVDAGQIEQVISNLAVNARDAMPRGGRLTIETQDVTIDEGDARQLGMKVPPGSYVRLTVSDSGVGMDEATRQRIFEPFFTTKGPGKGTGLGLSTVYGIVNQSHGFISVDSEIGHGTSFKVYLPRVTEAAGPDLLDPTVVSGASSETILLVEDNPGLRSLAVRVLGSAGYVVLGAGTADEAIRLLERHAPVHLLLTDVVMPGGGGRELAQRVARIRPEMKVLFMSGYTDDTAIRHGVLDGKVPFLSKPFTAEALLRKLREVLNSPG